MDRTDGNCIEEKNWSTEKDQHPSPTTHIDEDDDELSSRPNHRRGEEKDVLEQFFTRVKVGEGFFFTRDLTPRAGWVSQVTC